MGLCYVMWFLISFYFAMTTSSKPSPIRTSLLDIISKNLSKDDETTALLAIHKTFLKACLTLDDIIALNHEFDIAIDDSSVFTLPAQENKELQAKRSTARKESGAYYSPDCLVDFLVHACILEPLKACEPEEALKRLLTLKILDPAMGTGAFLLRAYAAMFQFAKPLVHHLACPLKENALKQHLLDCLYGIDLNERAVKLVQQTFDHIMPHSDLSHPHFICGNTIASPLRCHLNHAIPTAQPQDQRALSLSHAPLTTDELKQWFEHSGWHALPEDFDASGQFAPFTIENVFSDVFQYPRGGFDIILMNPPWNKLVISQKQFFASSLDRTQYPTRKHRNTVIEKWSKQYQHLWQTYQAHEAEIKKRIFSTTARPFCHLTIPKTGHTDAYAMFLERAWLLLRDQGTLGAILPNAFYANHSSAAERMLMFTHMTPQFLFGFHNRAKLFPSISAGMRFCLFKATKSPNPAPQTLVETGFGFLATEALIQARQQGKTRHDTIERALGLHGEIVAECNEAMPVLPNATTFAHFMASEHLSLGQEINVTLCHKYIESINTITSSPTDARLEPQRSYLNKRGYLILHEKGSFCAYDASLKHNVRYLFHASQYAKECQDSRLSASQYYRIACRSTIHASEPEKTSFALLAPGCVVANSALTERHPEQRDIKSALVLMAVANTHMINQIAKAFINTNLKLFVINGLPFPRLTEAEKTQLALLALRISKPAQLFEPLFEQFQTTPVTEETERQSIQQQIEQIVRTAFYRSDETM